MPIDPTTLDSATPQTTGGRSYPDHLRPYKAYDSAMLALFDGQELTFDDLVLRVTDARTRSIAPRWLASATWRGLIERRIPDGRRPRTYALTARGERELPSVSA